MSKGEKAVGLVSVGSIMAMLLHCIWADFFAANPYDHIPLAETRIVRRAEGLRILEVDHDGKTYVILWSTAGAMTKLSERPATSEAK